MSAMNVTSSYHTHHAGGSSSPSVPVSTTSKVAGKIFIALALLSGAAAVITGVPLFGITAVVLLFIGIICLAPTSSRSSHSTVYVDSDPAPTYYGPAPAVVIYGATTPAPPSPLRYNSPPRSSNRHGAGYSAFHTEDRSRGTAPSIFDAAPRSSHVHGGGFSQMETRAPGTSARGFDVPSSSSVASPVSTNAHGAGFTAFATRPK